MELFIFTLRVPERPYFEESAVSAAPRTTRCGRLTRAISAVDEAPPSVVVFSCDMVQMVFLSGPGTRVLCSVYSVKRLENSGQCVKSRDWGVRVGVYNEYCNYCVC
jgi:hypothetical protein